MKYNPSLIEKKWQKKWSEINSFRANIDYNKPKYYVLEGIKYEVDKSVRFEKKDNKSFLTSGKNSVEVPKQYSDLTQYILDREFVTDRLILTEFKDISKEVIRECIENLTKMKVLK